MRLLFATANPNQPGLLADTLLAHGCDWQLLAFARCEDAQWEMDNTAVDAVIADVGMPGCEALLRHVQQHAPGTARLVMTPTEEEPAALRLLSLVHGMVARDLDTDALIERLQSYTRLISGLARPSLREAVGKITRLPSSPKLYLELNRAMQDDSVDLGDVTALISRDPVVAARVLQIANSALYGRGRPVPQLAAAVMRLGLRPLRNIVLAAELYAQPARDGTKADVVQQRALLAAWLAPRLLEGHPDAETAATAALLAAISQLLPALPADPNSTPLDPPIEDEAAAYLLGLWGLPDILQQAVAWQQRPRSGGNTFGVVGAVHVATALAGGRTLDLGWLESTGMSPHLAHWRELLDRVAA